MARVFSLRLLAMLNKLLVPIAGLWIHSAKVWVSIFRFDVFCDNLDDEMVPYRSW